MTCGHCAYTVTRVRVEVASWDVSLTSTRPLVKDGVTAVNTKPGYDLVVSESRAAKLRRADERWDDSYPGPSVRASSRHDVRDQDQFRRRKMSCALDQNASELVPCRKDPRHEKSP